MFAHAHAATVRAEEMRRFNYLHVDVFADRAFGGNPLTVFLDASALSKDEMQAIARETNHSETTFLFPAAKGGAARVRIFTPALELPFAGHPVLGTAFAIAAHRGLTPATEMTLELAESDVVTALEAGDRARFVWMTQKAPEAGRLVTDVDRIARALGIGRGDLDGTARVWTTGMPFLFVPLTALTPMNRMRPNPQVLHELLLEAGARGIYAVCRETARREAAVHARCFPVGVGVGEDAATGSAAGALEAFALENAWIRPGRFEVEQGVEMGRPSTIVVEVKSAAEAVRVGGKVVPMGAGELVLE